MDAALKAAVRKRANDSCEYCQLRQVDLPFARFQMEHIIPRKHGGSDEADNLALACDRCNSHKGPNLTGIDSETAAIVPIFNPRTDAWADHFRQSGSLIEGRTPTGRTTVRVLNMNEPARVRLRNRLQIEQS